MDKTIGSIMILVGVCFLGSIYFPQVIFGKNWANDLGIFYLLVSYFLGLGGILSMVMGIGMICGWYDK